MTDFSRQLLHRLRRLRERGSITVMYVMLLPVLLGFSALAVDISRVLVAKQELQNAADAAALAGAAALSSPGGEVPYNWTAGAQEATRFISKNLVATRVLTDGTVTVGYVRPGDTDQVVHSPNETGWIQPFDVPVVRVALSLSIGHNGGPLNLIFGTFMGEPTKDLFAKATASAYPPGYVAKGSAFPMVIGRCLYDLFWDYSARRPRIDPATGKPYKISIGSIYNSNCLSGEWSTFGATLNDVPAVRALIGGGNPAPIRIGDSTYIQSGVKDSVYSYVPVNKDVVVLVVNQVVTGSYQTVMAMAAFHIESVVRIDGNSHIIGHFTDGLKSVGLSAGSGGGQDLGADGGIPSILIQ